MMLQTLHMNLMGIFFSLYQAEMEWQFIQDGKLLQMVLDEQDVFISQWDVFERLMQPCIKF